MHIKVFNAIKDYPQGLLLSQIQEFAVIKSKQLALYYLNYLIQKEYVEKRQGLYFAKAHAGSAIPFTPPTQRPHAFRATSKLFMSHTSRAEQTLKAKGIECWPTLKGSCLEIRWRSLALRLFKNGRLETRPSLPEYPLNVPLQTIKLRACHEAGVVFEAFLSETGLRCVRDRLGRLAIEITYWENSYPKNQIAKETMPPGEKVVYAYDRETSKEAIWGDMSLNPFVELETNSAKADTEIKLMMQAINDGEIRPYEDEIRTRRELDSLKEISRNNTEGVALFKQWLAHHDAKIVADTKFMDAMTKKLNQKRLFE